MIMLFDVLGILKKWKERERESIKKKFLFHFNDIYNTNFFFLSEINFVLLEYLAKVWTEWRHTKALIISSLSG